MLTEWFIVQCSCSMHVKYKTSCTHVRSSFNTQRFHQLDTIRQFSPDWHNTHTNWFNLESIRHWSFGKAWMNWLELHRQIGIIWQYYCSQSHFLCSLLFIHVPILIHLWQLTVNCATHTHTHLPRFKRGANIFDPSNQRDNLRAGFCASCSCLDLGIILSTHVDTITSTEDIIKVIAYSQKWRDIAHDNSMHLEEETADHEGKFGLTDDERITLDHTVGVN